MTNSPKARRPFLTRPLTWILAVVIIVVLVVGVLVGTRMYAASENSAAPEAFSDQIDSAGADGTEGAGGEVAGEWTIGEGSEAGYRVAEVLNGDDVTVVGRTEDVTGSVTIDGTELSSGAVTVDLSTVATDNDRRDGYFSSQAIDTSEHPDATFTVLAPVDLSALADSGTVEVQLPGTLEINGSSNDATANVTATQTDDGLAVTGSIDVAWSDYGVEAPDLGFVSVEDTGQVEFSLALTAA
ncbi:MAG: YceI family protein [Brevibacterium sp.]